MEIRLRDVVVMALGLALALLLMSGCAKKTVLHSTPPASDAARADTAKAEPRAGKPAAVAEIPSAKAVAETALDQEAAAAPAPQPSQAVLPEDEYEDQGLACWYGEKFHGKHTASGEVFDANAFTAAHRVLPFGSMVEVTNLENGKRVVVRINDRGPFEDVEHRIIDLSRASAQALGMGGQGLIPVKLRRIGSDASTGPESPVAVESASLPGATRVAVVEEKTVAVVEEKTAVVEEETAAVVETVEPSGDAVVAMVDTREEWISATDVKKPALAVSAGPVSGKYYVQVGAFTENGNADKVLADLRSRGYADSRIVPVERNGKRFLRVQAGAFAGREEAEQAMASLKADYPRSLVATD